jgi:hypothetical protein
MALEAAARVARAAGVVPHIPGNAMAGIALQCEPKSASRST